MLWLTLVATLLLALGLGSFKSWKLYERGKLFYQEVTDLQNHIKAPIQVQTVRSTLPALKTLQNDLDAFKAEVRPLLWLGPKFAWVPVYGNDLASAPALIELAEHLLNASILSLQASQPLLDVLHSPTSDLDPEGLTTLLLQAQPQLMEARQELDQALATREQMDASHFSPRLQRPPDEQIDPLLKSADDGLSLALALPGVVGATHEGPKTYLLLVQNEDELRPTGGFITSVGNLVLQNGEVISLDFESVDNDADWTQPYPAAPWQLQEYMNSPVLILRDANWFTDFPTTVLWAESLYAYTHSHSVDGVIAFDQHFLVMLLEQVGPLNVEGAAYPITAKCNPLYA